MKNDTETMGIGTSDLFGWIVELQPGCWIAPWEGDPGRTLVKASAQIFDSPKDASDALDRASDFREFTAPAITRIVVPNKPALPRAGNETQPKE